MRFVSLFFCTTDKNIPTDLWPPTLKISELESLEDFLVDASSGDSAARTIVVIIHKENEQYPTSSEVLRKVHPSLKMHSNVWLILIEWSEIDQFYSLVLGESLSFELEDIIESAFTESGRLNNGAKLSFIDRRVSIIDLESDGEPPIAKCLKSTVSQVLRYLEGRFPYTLDCRHVEFSMSTVGLKVSSHQVLLNRTELRSTKIAERVALSNTYLVSSASSPNGAVEVATAKTWYEVEEKFRGWRQGHVNVNAAIDLQKMGLQHKIRDIMDVLERRKSAEKLTSDEVDFARFSSLLGSGAGGKGKEKVGDLRLPRRKYPTAGSLATTKILVAVKAVEQVPDGTYYFNQDQYRIEKLMCDYGLEDIARNAGYEAKIMNCAFAVLFVADLSRLGAKYHERAGRLALLEIGHLAQNLIVLGTALRLTVCPISGFDELRVAKELGFRGPFLHTPYLLLFADEGG